MNSGSKPEDKERTAAIEANIAAQENRIRPPAELTAARLHAAILKHGLVSFDDQTLERIVKTLTG